jgi:hypothetical protein
MARPFKEPDVSEEVLHRLAAICCTMNEISAVSGLSVDTLERNYADIIKSGREIGKATLRREQYRLAMLGNPTMLIWLGKQLLGQRDKAEITVEEADVSFDGLSTPSSQLTVVN